MTPPIRWGLGHVGHQTANGGGAMLVLSNCVFCNRLMPADLHDRGFCDPCRDSLMPDACYVQKPTPPTPPPTDVDLDAIEYTPPTAAELHPIEMHEWAAWMPWWIPTDLEYEPA